MALNAVDYVLEAFEWWDLGSRRSVWIAASPGNRPNGSVVYLAQVEGLGSQVNHDPGGPRARQFTG